MATIATVKWKCNMCKAMNKSADNECDFCGTKKPTENASFNTKPWKCSSCNFVNVASALTCAICCVSLSNSKINDNEHDQNDNNVLKDEKKDLMQNNYVPSHIICQSISKCTAIERIIKALDFHKSIQEKNNNQLLLNYFERYKDLINDYHHILTVHLDRKTKQENDKNFHLIHEKVSQFITCDIRQCQQYRNNNRNRGRPEIQSKDKDSLYYIDWLDSIHCYLLHSYDVGFRIKISDYYHNKHNIDDEKQNDVDNDDINTETLYHDPEMERIKLHLSNKRKKLENIRGIDRVQHTKYNTAFAPIHKDNEEKKKDQNIEDDEMLEVDIQETVDEVQQEQDVKLVEFFFGNRFLYWDFFKDNDNFNQWYISNKYDNIKDEIINNKIYNIEHDQYTETYQKAKAILNDSLTVRSMRSIENYCYKIKNNMSLDIDHVLSIIFYTDYDTLSYNFSKTYRKTTMSETDESLKKTNSEYWNWGKLITETVECYGLPLHSSNISVFYHGTSMLYFTSFVTKFCCPTSTTPQLQVAAIFAKWDGIILELEKYALGYDLRYFNCSLFSCYGNEDERLFAGGYKELQLKSIRAMEHDQNYQFFIESLRLFDKFIHAKRLIPDEKSKIRKRDYQIIEELIDEVLDDEYHSKHPVYIKQCFRQFCAKTEAINIDLQKLKMTYDGYMECFLEPQFPNLVQLDKLAMIFARCSCIFISMTRNVSVDYIKCIASMLREINNVNSNYRKDISIRFQNACFDYNTVHRAWNKYSVIGWCLYIKAQWKYLTFVKGKRFLDFD